MNQPQYHLQNGQWVTDPHNRVDGITLVERTRKKKSSYSSKTTQHGMEYLPTFHFVSLNANLDTTNFLRMLGLPLRVSSNISPQRGWVLMKEKQD